MPVPRFGSAPADRPSGLIPPPVDLAGVTELRLHGVGGGTPEQLLGDLAPQQVAGDRIAGFYRTADTAADSGGRHVEAYSWGGLTSYSGWRVLWVLLLPFALANVAGWMCTRATYRSRWRFRLHRTVVRWAALGLTVNLLVLLAMTGMDLVGYQCGGRPECADPWWLGPLRWSAVVDHPGRRVLLGTLAPLLAVAVLAVLALRSIRRYEQPRPPVAEGRALRPPSDRGSAAQPGLGLPDRRFWDGRRAALDLGQLHLAAGLAVIALLLAHTVDTTVHGAGIRAVAPVLWLLALVAGGAVLVGVLVLVALDACPQWRLPAGQGSGREAPRPLRPVLRLLERGVTAPPVLLAVAAAALVCAGWFATVQPALATLDGEHLPGLRNAANVAFAGILGLLALVLGSTLLGGWRRGTFFIFGPLVALVLGVSVLNTVLLAFTLGVPRVLGAGSQVFPVLRFSLPYLVLVLLGFLLGFGGYQLAASRRAGKSWRRVRDEYQHAPAPDAPQQWTVDAAQGKEARRWAARIARLRRLARAPRQLPWLLAPMVVTGVALLLGVLVWRWFLDRQIPQTSWTQTVSSWLGMVLPVLVVLLLRRGWRSLDSRRRIGVLWDVLTFWPRAYHPLAPPSYAERAVPELQRRLWRKIGRAHV